MKKIYCLLAIFIGLACNAQNINIPDASLKTKLLAITPSSTTIFAIGASGNWLDLDANNDGEIQVSEASLVHTLKISQTNNITSLVGIEQFTNLREFVYHFILLQYQV